MNTNYNGAEGERRKQHALTLMEAHRQTLINRGRRAMLSVMLAGDGTATADDVRAAVKVPAGMNESLFGAVPGTLARAGIIVRQDRLRVSTRPERHAGFNRVWQLADRPAAEAWLIEHPDRPDLDATDCPTTLFDPTTNKEPGAVTPGSDRKD